MVRLLERAESDSKALQAFLSEFLTIRHTLEVMKYCFSNEDADELVSTDKYLKYYFPEDMFVEVRAYHARRTQQPDSPEDTDLGAVPSWESFS